MIYLTGNISAPKWHRDVAQTAPLGMLLSPDGWRKPHCSHYALDNDVFAHSFLGGRPDPEWWNNKGECAWLKMLDKIPDDHKPLWVLLPDVVADWEQTIERAYQYRPLLVSRGLKVALALQDGADLKSIWEFAPDAVFVAGSTEWKWRMASHIAQTFQGKIWTHLARCNGEKRIRRARQMGFDSADGTGLCRFWDKQLPRVLNGLYTDSPQLELF